MTLNLRVRLLRRRFSGCSAELHRGHQGRRHRWWRRQRGQPDDRGRAARCGVHRRQHRRSGAAHERRGREARRRQGPDPRARCRRRPRRGSAGRRGARGGDRGGPQGGRHGLRDRRRGRRHGHRRCADRGPDRPPAGGAHRRRRDPTLRLRGPSPADPGRDRHRGPARRGGHAHRDPQRPAALDQRPQRERPRRVPLGRPGPALRCRRASPT